MARKRIYTAGEIVKATAKSYWPDMGEIRVIVHPDLANAMAAIEASGAPLMKIEPTAGESK